MVIESIYVQKKGGSFFNSCQNCITEFGNQISDTRTELGKVFYSFFFNVKISESVNGP